MQHANGSQITFHYDTSTQPPDGTPLIPEVNGSGQLYFVSNLPSPASGSGFKYVEDGGDVEFYDSTGKLVVTQNRDGLQHTYSYNASGQLWIIKDATSGRTLTFAYDASGRLHTMTDPANGNYTYDYSTDGNGNLAKVTYPDGTYVQYVYDGNFVHDLAGLIDENNNRYATWTYYASGANAGLAQSNYLGSSSLSANLYSVGYSLDSGGKVLTAAITEPTSQVRTLTFTTDTFRDQMLTSSAQCAQCGNSDKSRGYDANGFVNTRTDFNGNVTNYTSDATGLETSRTEAYGTPQQRTIATTWDASRQPSLVSEPGRTTAYTYDTVGHLLTKTVTDTATSAVRTTTYTYNAQGLLATVKDPLNHVTSYGYDAQGNLDSITNALNQVTQITAYDANGMPLTIVDPNNVETDLTYDARQRLLTRTVAGAETQFTYDPVGNLTQVTLPGGSYLKYAYDTAHRLTGITDSANSVGDGITYTLDDSGNRIGEATKDPSGTLKRTLSRTYNSLDQLIKLVGGAGQITHYTPDGLGNVIGITDPMNQPTAQAFDALNRLSAVVDPEQGKTAYTYDALDRVQQITDPNKYQTQYSYDAFGDVVQQVSPDTGTTTYTYDLAGNRLTKTDARGLTATYSYDSLNRLTGITYLDTSKDVTYTYDQGSGGIGHLTGIADASGTTAYSYDDHGNTTQKVVTLGTHTFIVGYGYDSADNLASMTYPSGLTVNYTRDAAERVTEVDANSSPVVSSITYEPFGPITGLTYGNGLTESRSYDLDYRLTGISVPGLLAWTLADNADDDITSITDSLNGSNSQTLGYDNLNRLTSAGGAYGNLGFTYDLDGNRTQETTGGLATDLTYDTVSNKLFEVGVQGYQYDAVGNLISDGSHTYNYDVTNRLQGFDSVSSAYVYNGLGQRSIKFPDVGADTTPPSVTITAPADGAEVSGTVNVTAAAADNVGVTSVQFKLDGANLGSAEANAPYAASWNTTTANQGPHTLTATATDAAGNTGTASVVVYIPDTIPPTVAITAPANGASVSGTVTLTATASDNIGVASVQFQLDGTDIGAALTSAPYILSWDSTTSIGSHVLTAVARDTSGNSTTSAAVSITVLDIALTANNGSLTTSVNVAGNGTLAATLAYPTQTLTFAAATAPAHGTVTITNAATGAFTYSPAAGYVGPDSFTFTATDNYGTVSNTATESVTVGDLTATAVNGSLTTNVNVAGSGTLAATLAYPTQTLTFAIATAPAHGTVTVTNAATGAFTYTPTANYVGADSFTFEATDSDGTVSNAATESVTVADVAATAVNGSLTTNVNTTGNGTLATTLAYPTQALTFAMMTASVHGMVTITNTATGAFTYAPTANYIGTDSFTFEATDSDGKVTNIATESVTVVDVAATATNGSLSTDVGVSGNGTLAATLAYSTQTLTYAVIASPSHGSVTITNASTGAFTYIPAAAYAGVDSFRFNVTDAHSAVSNTATESVTVVDVTPPTVSMTAPSSGSDLSGTVTVSATASDNVGVASVQFQLDGANLGSPVTAAPYTLSWNTTTASGGSHVLTAIAKDAAGNAATSAGVSITVDNTPPTVSITSPANNASVSGTISITASASDNIGVTKVQFKLDGNNLGSAVTSSPYTVSWNTASASNSTHTLTAVAYDAAGNATTSSTVTVTVPVQVPLAPSLTTSSETPDPNFSATLSWSPNSTPVTSYVLQSSSNSSFTTSRFNPVQVYSGTATSYVTTATGPIYYRVEACNSAGCSAWSTVIEVDDIVCDPSGVCHQGGGGGYLVMPDRDEWWPTASVSPSDPGRGNPARESGSAGKTVIAGLRE